MYQDSSPPPSECPLCMEEFDMDDKSFFPCTCGYQICRFCWHRIKSESQPDISPTCPACRKPYTDSPANFKPAGDVRKKGKKLKVNKKQLQELRVVQKNLIFVVGLSGRIADTEVLKRGEYFGRFGKIVKVVVNQPREPTTTASAYITYARSDDALRALTSVNNATFDNKTIKANLGTTKYCSHFLRNSACPKAECMYLHSIGEPEASFTKEDMTCGRHADYERGLVEGFLKTEREKGIARSRPPSQDSPPLALRELTPTPPRIEEDTPPSPPDPADVDVDVDDNQVDDYGTDDPQSSSPPPDEEEISQPAAVYEDILDYEHEPRVDFGTEFNPFGDTQQQFEDMIQQEVREGEKLRQGLPPGLPPPGFHSQDTWSSLDPAIIFSSPSTIAAGPGLQGLFGNLATGFQDRNYSYFQTPPQLPLQNNGDAHTARMNFQSFPPPGFHHTYTHYS